MKSTRTFFLLLTTTIAFAQSASVVKEMPEIDEPIFRGTVTNVVAPVLVTDRGRIVDGLQPADFHLYDNGKEQNIQVDVTSEPLSLVVAIQCSNRVETILNQVKKLGTLIPPLVTGVNGEAAVVAFDSRLRLMQDFTNDPDKIKAAVDKITPGGTQNRMIDAVDRSIFMLRHRPKNNRKVILLVSETRDQSSETRVRETLLDATFSNVQIYTVDISQVMVRLTERQDVVQGRMDPTMAPPGVMGQPNTPTTMEQYAMSSRVQFIPVLKEIYTNAKGLFVKDPATQFARGTGGGEFLFLRQKGLEDAVQKVSQEIHSQYLISYNPNNAAEGGYHTIEVSITGKDYNCKTRPGYWIGGGKQ